ncbi:MAG: hypothetical protein IJ642_01340 [Oscillospiraceae bacterium]|nr:hypothetical protein [Oscillospiraceae bacterium]
MNKNANIQKINKTGKLCRIFSKIIMICCIVGAVLTAIAGIISKVSPENIGIIASGEISPLESVTNCIVLAFSAVFYFFAVRFSKKIETCDTPFSDDIIREMKIFGIAYLIAVYVFGFTDSSFSAGVPSVLMILLLVNSFAYGAELQKESDETL